MRSARISASARSWVQSRIVVSWIDPHLADEVLHLELRARVEARRRLVEQQQDRRGQQRPRERDLLLGPAREVLHRVRRAATTGKPTRSRISGIRVARLARRQPVEPRRVGEVLDRRHLLEERRLDRDAVDHAGEPPASRRCRARRCARCRRPAAAASRAAGRASTCPEPFWPSIGDALAARDLEREPAQRLDADALAPVLADELLAQVVELLRPSCVAPRLQQGRTRMQRTPGAAGGARENPCVS